MRDEFTVITDPGQATPEWLTWALRQSGRLPAGAVTAVQASTELTYTSTIARLSLTYSAGAPPTAPPRLFLKMSRLDSQQRVVGNSQRRHEVDFNTRVTALMPAAPVARCYQAVYCEETGASHLLFDDLSATHYGGASMAPPGRPACESAMDAFAALHAFWWDNPALPTLDEPRSEASVACDIAAIRDCFPGFADFAADRLPAAQRRLYGRVLEQLPRLYQRVTRGEHLTLIHGDANLLNVLLPCDPSTDQALIIDWQLWGISFAAEDLAHLIALYWDKAQRDAMERGLLTRYHAGLQKHGVRNYPRADSWNDYRLAVIIRVLFMPMWFWNSGAPAASVWHSLERAMQAFDDLGCLELLDG